jgi:putative DNA primase/helicase
MRPDDLRDFAVQLDADIASRKANLHPPHPPDGVVLVRGTDLSPEPVCWLWQYWLAMGKLHILAGAPGQGKTTLVLAMAAIVTRGGLWPDGTRSEAGNVLIWSGEDDPRDTLLPRLLAAGADRSRCFFVTGARVDGEIRAFDPARDLVDLLAAVDGIGGIKLLMVDPVVSAVTGDSHKNTEVRRSLQPLVELAAACRCAVVGVTHFAKGGQGQDPTQRVVGSVAFAAVARLVMVAAKVNSEAGRDTRILARSKSNIGPDEGGFEYCIEQVEALIGIEAARITWGKAVRGSARDLLAESAEDVRDSLGDAGDLLRAELSSTTWTPASVARKQLLEAGFSKSQIWKASKKLGVIRTKGAMQEGWYWRLPTGGEPQFQPATARQRAEGSEDSSSKMVEPSRSSVAPDPDVEVEL